MGSLRTIKTEVHQDNKDLLALQHFNWLGCNKSNLLEETCFTLESDLDYFDYHLYICHMARERVSRYFGSQEDPTRPASINRWIRKTRAKEERRTARLIDSHYVDFDKTVTGFMWN